MGVSIFNNTNTNIEFDPGQITAIGRFFKKNKNKVAEDSYINVADSCFYYDPNQVQTKDMRIWNFADYTKKVHRRQQWDQVLVALSETQAAQNASYSTSETTSLTHGTTHAYGNSNTFGSFNTNSYKSNHSVTYSTTKTFDATAAAIANERAAKNIAAYAESLEDEANAINESYLQPTTIDPQTQMAGYFLINKDKPHIIDLTIPINGVAYQFHFTEIPK
ncbi:MAG: hypothetical protein IJ808_06980 [Muribaculaceae bacterium]|nr:hypothetical protein [Muribaculaceae bacterium]